MIKKGVCSPLRGQQDSIVRGEAVRVIEVFPEIENRFLALFVRGAYGKWSLDLCCQMFCVTCAVGAADEQVVCVPAKVFGLERHTVYNRVDKDWRNAANQQSRYPIDAHFLLKSWARTTCRFGTSDSVLGFSHGGLPLASMGLLVTTRVRILDRRMPNGSIQHLGRRHHRLGQFRSRCW